MAIASLSLIFLLFVAVWYSGGAVYIAYNTSAGIVDGKLNVHLVPHSHDDVGWLKTVDQYYVGLNNSIQVACVQNVLDSLIPELLADKNRKFIYVEQAFFQRWWRQQSDGMKKTVKELVSSGQLELLNGGMCMHDEATTHYIDMIDQTTRGHRFIKQEFGQTPRIGWQIDPFGHAAVQSYLLGAEVGFDALYFFRIDYQDREKRKNLKSLEVIWRGSKTLGSSADIFSGIFPKNYEPPPGGFYFEINDDGPVIQDDPLLFDYNVEERVNDFVAAALSQANITRTNHIMFTMGTDFKYQYAHTWFRQMDKFIHYVNRDGRVNAFYSTPSIYTDAKYAAKESWPLKTGDFFPYADNPNAYWTGYFTSRPALKGYVRLMSGYYMAARQLEFFSGRSSTGPTTDSLADALALAQHHDAVSGTEKQHVANDYAKRLSIGFADAEKVVKSSLACLTESVSNSGCSNPKTKFEQCPLLNISYCPPSEMELSNGKSLVVLAYNSLGWKREDMIRIPVVSGSVVVYDSEGKQIESQLVPIVKASLGLRSDYAKAYLGSSPRVAPIFWLVFPVSIPPLGFNTYFVSTAKQTGLAAVVSTRYSSRRSKSSTVEVGPGALKLSFNTKKGKLSYYSNIRSSVNASIEHSYSYYAGESGSGSDPQASGAYIFRPNGTFPIKSNAKLSSTILRGPLIDEVHQQINPWIYQITRTYKTKEHAEVEFTVGPIPINDGIGKEVATQITTAMVTNKTFYTDSNGRDFLKRIRDYRSDWELQVNQPVAGNYYPINLGIYIEDDSNELSILVDRSVGGSSIVDGQIELMLHRRLLHDDGRGVDEALNEVVCVSDKCEGLTVQGKYYLRIDPKGEGSKWRRSFGQEIYSPLLLAFSEQDGGNWVNSHAGKFSAMAPSYSLADNVALLTLQSLEDGTALLRLAHLYEVGEDKDLSTMASVELRKIFPGKKISKVTETNLSANQERAAMEKKRLRWTAEGSQNAGTIVRGGPVDPAKLVVELGRIKNNMKQEEEMDPGPGAMMENDQTQQPCRQDGGDCGEREEWESSTAAAAAASCSTHTNTSNGRKERGGGRWGELMPSLKTTGNGGGAISLSLRVLLVEGDDSTRHIISALLRACHYHVAAVSDGLKAWETLRESPHRIDVVLAEVDAPSLSGISLLSMIMSHASFNHIPVIMMSPNDSINMVFNCMLKGAADFLVKPVRKNELRNLWQHVWRRQAVGAGAKAHHDDDSEERFETDPRKCSGKASDADSSCTMSDMVAESAYNQNSLEHQQTCHGFSHIIDNICAEGTIQPNRSLLDHEHNDEGKSIMLGSECAPVDGTSIANEQLLEEDHSCARVETANEVVKTTGYVCNKSVTNDMEDQPYDEVTPTKQIVDFIGVIDNQRQNSYMRREHSDIDNNVHGAPEDFFHDVNFSSKLSSAPFLELSLKRCGHNIVDMEEKSERSTLNHSDLSAFSIYNRRTPLSPLSRTVNLQTEGEEYCSPYTIQIPDKVLSNSSNVPRCNGTSQHVNTEGTESSGFGIFNQNGIAVKCSPIQVIPVHVPVGGMKLDGSTGYHTMTQPIFYPEPSGHFLWNSDPSNGQDAICMSTSHQLETIDSSSHQHPETPIIYSAQLEHREMIDEPWHSATATGDNASSRICHGDGSSHVDRNGHGVIFHEGNGNISTPNISLATPESRSQSDLHRISQREAALNKFRLKRKERCFEKKVRYQSRKRLAEQRPRVKGQFVRHIQPDAMDCQVEQAVG